MPRRYVFITGGVISGLGKGVTASALGRLLKSRGFRVTMQKFDPYLNVDPGTLHPSQHGEVFVTDDGAETDLDLGHYERFIDESLTRRSNVTTGQIYQTILEKERRGAFHGITVQVIPHITDEIKSRILQDVSDSDSVTIVEVGGTVGDIEGQPFLEAIRQFQRDVGLRNAIIVHVTLVPYVKVSQEIKTKPTQTSVRVLQSMGLFPDCIVCRSQMPLGDDVRAKISLFCGVPKTHVLENLDMEHLYELPLALEKQGFVQAVCQSWEIECPPIDFCEWENVVRILRSPIGKVTIAIVGKYFNLRDSYISVVEALTHGGIAHRTKVEILWVDADEIGIENVSEKLTGAAGLIVPGGSGESGCLGKICAISHARVRKIPYLGICLGMQLAVVEFARNVIGLDGADSTEFNPETPYPVIDVLERRETLRRGAYDCVLKEGSRVAELYGSRYISERHRHRFEVNNRFREMLVEHGMGLSGLSPDEDIVEMVEVGDHPYFVGTQAHPEFKSRPNRPHPLFAGLIGSSLCG